MRGRLAGAKATASTRSQKSIMSETTHQAAIMVQDGEAIAVVVEVDAELLEDLGEDTVYDAVSSHPWARKHGVPVVLGYELDDEVSFMGPEDLTDAAEDHWDNLRWKHKLTIDWDEIDEEKDDEDDEDDEEEED